MSITPIPLQWGFATNAENTSVGVRNDGSIVSTFVSNSVLDYNLSAAYGQLTVNNGTPGFTFWGTDWNFDKGDEPSVAIDPTGLVVSVHTENGPGTKLYLNFGSANGGQGGFVSPSFESSMNGCGDQPFITCIGDGLFLVFTPGENLVPSGWQIQVFTLEGGGYSASITAITFNVPANMASQWPSQFIWPRPAYDNGILAIIDLPGSLAVYLGTYDTSSATFSFQYRYSAANPVPGMGSPPCSIALGPASDIYFAVAGPNDSNNGELYFYYGTYSQGNTWSLSVTQEQLLQDVNNGNYAQAIDMGYITMGDYSGVVLAVLGETNCIDIFTIPNSQLT